MTLTFKRAIWFLDRVSAKRFCVSLWIPSHTHFIKNIFHSVCFRTSLFIVLSVVFSFLLLLLLFYFPGFFLLRFPKTWVIASRYFGRCSAPDHPPNRTCFIVLSRVVDRTWWYEGWATLAPVSSSSARAHHPVDTLRPTYPGFDNNLTIFSCLRSLSSHVRFAFFLVTCPCWRGTHCVRRSTSQRHVRDTDIQTCTTRRLRPRLDTLAFCLVLNTRVTCYHKTYSVPFLKRKQ